MPDTEVTMGDAAYARLKSDRLRGHLRSGERLDLAELARLYEMSVTPIREAVLRLLGERLVVTHPKGGFAIPVTRADDLVGALTLHRDLLLLALAGPQHAAPSPANIVGASATDPYPLAARALFEHAATLSSNPTLREFISTLNDRLEQFREHEPEVLPAARQELEKLQEHLESGDLPALRLAVRDYHRRRAQRASQILWTSSQPGSQS